MRIAFTSCMLAQVFHDQPVWREIGDHNPDVLVLLGDSIYLDNHNRSTEEIQKMPAANFAVHAHQRYREQLMQRDFKALIERPGLQVHAIWDDHDFMFNDACGAEVQTVPEQADKIPVTRALFAAYRKALKDKQAGSFPAAPPPVPPAGAPAPPPPGYSMVDLGDGICLHLTDDRSFKTHLGRNALLGAPQMAAMETQFRAKPDAVHLVASGITFEHPRGETWAKCRTEHDQLLQWAKSYRLLMLSGDIHDNNLASYPAVPGGARQLHEATASGAAVNKGVDLGAPRRNWGLLEIDAAQVRINTWQLGVNDYKGTIDRTHWTMTRP